jgi:YesN/AraC family two-component response regulator
MNKVKAKPIPDWPMYLALSNGQIWSVRSRKFLRQTKANKYGHLQVTLCVHKHCWQVHVHTLILLTFKGKRPSQMQCRHLDGNPINNTIKNLCWGTVKENIRDSIRQNRWVRGSKSGAAKLTESQVIKIRRMYRDGFTVKTLGKLFGVGRTNIGHIIHNRTWRGLFE